ncbi:hypothetical protein WS73_11965 [Burkholderia savannae]|nr:hypothetical protein WS73_11965 [Burkholderia savannae]
MRANAGDAESGLGRYVGHASGMLLIGGKHEIDLRGLVAYAHGQCAGTRALRDFRATRRCGDATSQKRPRALHSDWSDHTATLVQQGCYMR